MVDDGVHVGPCRELPFPVGDGGERSNDQERTLDACSMDLRQQRDGLNCLPQTHLICQDTVLPAKPDGHMHLNKITKKKNLWTCCEISLRIGTHKVNLGAQAKVLIEAGTERRRGKVNCV